MPAFCVLNIDPIKEPARISQPVDYVAPQLVFGAMSYAHIEIKGATREEMESIAAMINSIGARVAKTRAEALADE